ncbi:MULTISPECIES: type I-D CRISPR-associated protein Cas10d/Csc3 [Kamptonema]|uniref:type I-D CRISPR-associated protein Cas10d/Csc3 n=1 Tax=Kamptonema TaxID=1501433 RepID=UPI0001DAD14C|nr:MULTISPECIES: type I-D CRISPR-associated protein Cas10d/Csc3 [Kamptonema]CBN54048.1 hypothetical protein OSCI_520002 [Kamptonema sp. PCC 6506]
MSDFLQFIGLEDKPILTQFIEEVANKGLQQYQKAIQYGVHQGQSLYNHVVSGVFLIHSLQEILQLEEIELKTLTIAFCVHDLNKTYEGTARSYGEIATPDNVAKEIEKVGFYSFFENLCDYLEDITEIIRGHSGHNSVRGDSLDRRSDSTRLGKARLKELCHIIRAADVGDLSQGYSERKHKQTFLSHINRFTHRQYCFIAHQVSEQRGILTNIIHNQVAEFLSEKFEALPVFLYSQGTHYLVPVGTQLDLADSDLVKIGESVEQTINKMKSEEYGKFIKAGNQGIKIDEELLSLQLPYLEIFGQVNTIIQHKHYDLEEVNRKYRKKLEDELPNKKELEKRLIQRWLEKTRLMPVDEETMRFGELLRTFYIFLKKHRTQELAERNKSFRDPWIYIYQLLEIQDSEQYNVLDPLYVRAYVIVKNLSITYDILLNLMIQEANSLDGEEEQDDSETKTKLAAQISPLVSYVKNNLTFDFAEFTTQNFTNHLKVYYENNHKQSCYASAAFEASKWMSGNVPQGIKVQKFSNRLIGGHGEPKRYVDPVVREQFSIEKLNYRSSGDKFMYLHIMPYSFMTAPFIENFKNIFQQLNKLDVSAVSLSLKEALEFFRKQCYCILPIKNQKTTGILVPNHSEVVGNTISLPLTTVGDNKTEKYLNAIEYALMIHKHFGVKVLLSESSIPILNLTEHREVDIFLDGVPSTLRGLVPSEEIRFQRDRSKEPLGSGDILWQRLLAIRGMYDVLWTDSKENELVAMATAFTQSENHIFFVVDRLIEKKAQFMNKRKKVDKEVAALSLTRQLKEWI